MKADDPTAADNVPPVRIGFSASTSETTNAPCGNTSPIATGNLLVIAIWRLLGLLGDTVGCAEVRPTERTCPPLLRTNKSYSEAN